MDKIRIFDTLSGGKREFTAIRENSVSMYCCGPTVYNYIHVGNARPFVFFDIVRKYLEHQGYDVTYIQNITDIDDKIIARSAEEGVSWDRLSSKYAEAFFKDLEGLGVSAPTVAPKATDHIAEMIGLVRTLEEKGCAYVTEDGVYFRVASFKDYGKLSKKNLEDLRAGARVSVDGNKEDPADFALWKFSKPGEPSWESPWGKGRPGWHIECSAMSSKYAGGTLDIHAGGEDLVFPHHENEIAQSEAATGASLSNYWMHNAYVNINGAKMSKSLGNIRNVRELLKAYPSQVIRLFIISAHYRKLLDFTDAVMNDSVKKHERLKNFLFEFRDAGEARDDELVRQYDEKLKKFMNDDFNTSGALGVMFEAVSDVYADRDEKKAAAVIWWLRDWDRVFGILPAADEEEGGDWKALAELLIELRARAKKNRDFETADLIRERLKELGVILEDTPEGTRFKKS